MLNGGSELLSFRDKLQVQLVISDRLAALLHLLFIALRR